MLIIIRNKCYKRTEVFCVAEAPVSVHYLTPGSGSEIISILTFLVSLWAKK